MQHILMERMKDYKNYGSWAIFGSPEGKGYPFTTSSVLTFDSTDTASFPLRNDVIFLGFNRGEANSSESSSPGAWYNFHARGHNDHRIANALYGTPFWGSYMTDCIGVTPSNIKEAIRIVNSNPRPHIERLEKELTVLGAQDPLFVCFGNAAYEFMTKHMLGNSKIVKNKDKIVRLPHYSGSNNKYIYKPGEHPDITYVKIVQDALKPFYK